MSFIFETLENEGGAGFNARKLLFREKKFTMSGVEIENSSTHFLPLTKAENTIESCISSFFCKEKVPGNRVKAREFVLRTPFPPAIVIELGFRKMCNFESIVHTILKEMKVDVETTSQFE